MLHSTRRFTLRVYVYILYLQYTYTHECDASSVVQDYMQDHTPVLNRTRGSSMFDLTPAGIVVAFSLHHARSMSAHSYSH